MGDFGEGSSHSQGPAPQLPPCSPGSTLISCVLAPSLPRHDLTPSQPWRPQKRDFFLPHTRTLRPTSPLSPCSGSPGSLQGRDGRLSTPCSSAPPDTAPPPNFSPKLFAFKPYLLYFLSLRRICSRNPRRKSPAGGLSAFLPWYPWLHGGGGGVSAVRVGPWQPASGGPR